MSPGGRKYLSTTEMVTGLRKTTRTPIPQVFIPGDFRIYRPTQYDVLCGRGKPIQDHSGNLRLRQIVSKFTDQYMNARRHKKQEIVEEVVELVKNSGGVLARFLRRVGRENYWVEVPNAVACDKVSHALRCLVRKTEAGESIDLQEPESTVASSSSSVMEAAKAMVQATQPPMIAALQGGSTVTSPSVHPKQGHSPGLFSQNNVHALAAQVYTASPRIPMPPAMAEGILGSRLLRPSLIQNLTGDNKSKSGEQLVKNSILTLSNKHLMELAVASQDKLRLQKKEEATNAILMQELMTKVLEAEQQRQKQLLEQQALTGKLTLALLAMASSRA